MKRSRDVAESAIKSNSARKAAKPAKTERQVGEKRFFLAVAHRDHVLQGKQGGMVMVCHGKEAPLNKLRENDLLVYYSPRSVTNDKTTKNFMSFTAVCRVNGPIAKTDKMLNFRPAEFLSCEEAPIVRREKRGEMFLF